MKNILPILLMVLAGTPGWTQTKTERISKELSFEKKGPQNALLISNINGSVTVEGYSGNAIVVDIEKIIRGKTPERLEKGLKEIGLGVIDRADTIFLYVQGVCPPFTRQSKSGNAARSSWGYSWNQCDNRVNEYDYQLNFTIRVPAGVSVTASTINEGEISVTGVSGTVHAYNVNGGIRLTDLTSSAHAHTVNGNVDISYAENPQRECRFYTLNGDINAWFKKDLSSTVSFKSFNGEFFTNIGKLVALPAEVLKSESAQEKKYQVSGNRFQAGSGGALLDFETFNGNVYLREKQN